MYTQSNRRISENQKPTEEKKRRGVELVIWNSEVEQQVNLVKLMIVANWYVDAILCCVGVYKSLVVFFWSSSGGPDCIPRLR